WLMSRDAPSPAPAPALAPDTRRAGLVAGHDAMRGGNDSGAHAAEDLRNRLRVDVHPLARARHAAQAGDDRSAILGVLELHEDLVRRGAGNAGRLVVAEDVAL